jgi:hypothetical protein
MLVSARAADQTGVFSVCASQFLEQFFVLVLAIELLDFECLIDMKQLLAAVELAG